MTRSERLEKLLSLRSTKEADKALDKAAIAYETWKRGSPGYQGPQYDKLVEAEQAAYIACWEIVCEDVDQQLQLALLFSSHYRTPSAYKFLAQVQKTKGRVREGEKEREKAEEQQQKRSSNAG